MHSIFVLHPEKITACFQGETVHVDVDKFPRSSGIRGAKVVGQKAILAVRITIRITIALHVSRTQGSCAIGTQRET